MPQRPTNSALLLACIMVLFAVFVFDHERSRRELSTAVAEIDSLHRRVLVANANQDSLLAPGDRLPDTPLMSEGAESLSLRRVASARDFVYFSRDDCLPCQILRPLISSLAHDARARLTIVSLDPSASISGVHGVAQARLQKRGALGKQIQGIPTLVQVSSDGTVLSVVHASLPRVLRMLQAFNLASREIVDSLIGKEFAERNIPMSLLGARQQMDSQVASKAVSR